MVLKCVIFFLAGSVLACSGGYNGPEMGQCLEKLMAHMWCLA